MPPLRLRLFWLGLHLFWNGANSLIGLGGALGGQAAWHPQDQMLEVSGGWLITLLARAGWASAITFGDVVLYQSRELIPLLHAHERVHVKQYRVWGPFFSAGVWAGVGLSMASHRRRLPQ